MKINDCKFYGVVRDYLTIYLPSQKESSPNTVKSYREGLNLFLTYISNSKGIRLYEIGFDEMSPENLAWPKFFDKSADRYRQSIFKVCRDTVSRC